MMWDYEDDNDLDLNADMRNDVASSLAGSNTTAFSQVSLNEAVRGATDPLTLLHPDEYISQRETPQGASDEQSQQRSHRR